MILLEREKKKERVTNVKRKYRKLKKKSLIFLKFYGETSLKNQVTNTSNMKMILKGFNLDT